MNGILRNLYAYGPYGLFLLRLILGAILIYHGLGKLQGGFFIGPLNSMGVPLAVVLGPIVTILEFVGGILVLLGVLTRYVGILLFIQWVVIIIGFRLLGPLSGGWGDMELDLLIFATVIALLTNGSGRLSVGRMLGAQIDP